MHDFIIGYNNDGYDNLVCKRHGISFKGLISIDLMGLIHGKGFGNDLGRKSIMQTPDGTHLGTVLHGKSLEETAKAIAGVQKIADFDYNLFKTPFSTHDKRTQDLMIEYLEHDVLATRDIYLYMEEFFADMRDGGVTIDEELEALGFGKLGEFKPFMKETEIERKQYLTMSVASWTYSALCNICGIEKKFGDGMHIGYGGGFVALPEVASSQGKIYCLDYNSLYPHIMIMANLYGVQCKYDVSSNDEGQAEFYNVRGHGWQGNKISATDGLYGETMSKVSALLKKLYNLRLEYKAKKDERQYTTKIIINTIYGLLGNPAFVSVSNVIAASDCTRLGRQWVNAARDTFRDAGYDILYTDTDSVYLRDPFEDEERLMKYKRKHIEEIKASVPFPVDTFDMGIDDRIEYMMFVYDDRRGQYKKKNYLYVTQEGKLKLKGLPLMKSTATPLGRKVFDKFIKPEIISNNRGRGLKRHLFSKKQIEQWIEQELMSDIGLMSVFHKVKAPEEYVSHTSLKYQFAIDPNYGEGSHHMLKLNQSHPLGAGKQKNYIGIEHKNKISFRMLDLEKVWNELEPFVETEVVSLNKWF